MLIYLARLRPSGRRTQAAALDTLARALSGGRLGALELPWHLLRYPHTAALRSWLAETHQVGHRPHLSLGSARGPPRVLAPGAAEHRRVRARPRPGGGARRGAAPRPLTLGGELRAIFEALADDERTIARRNACALVLLVGAGVRRAELAGLHLDQVDTESGRVEVRQVKGRKDRVCWLPPSALPAVRDWLAVRGQAPGPLLQPVRKGGRVEDRALSDQAVRDLCQGLARLAATEPFTPHDLRRTWTGATSSADCQTPTPRTDRAMSWRHRSRRQC